MRIGATKFPNLLPKRLAGGRVGYYWNPPPDARKVFVGEALGDEADMASVMGKWSAAQKRLKAWRGDVKAGSVSVVPGPKFDSTDWLLEDYKASTWFTERAEKTQSDYRAKLAFVCNFRLADGRRFGDVPWVAVRPPHADKLYQAWVHGPDGDRVPYALSCHRLARILFYWGEHAYSDRAPPKNPFTKLKAKAPPARRIKWLPSEVRRFVEAAEKNGRLSVAVAALLCYELGQRVTDARILLRCAFEDGGKKVRVIQSKTNKELLLPVSHVLAACIAKLPAGQNQLVVDESTGAAYSSASRLSHVAAEIREKAGLPSHLQLRDLRRTCISELGDLGATDDELVSVSGHGDRQMLNIYSLREYKRALAAMQRRWDWRTDQETADREQEETEAA
jgi:integrase